MAQMRRHGLSARRLIKSRKRLVAAAILAAAVVGLSLALVIRPSQEGFVVTRSAQDAGQPIADSPSSAQAETAETASAPKIVVHVDGAVARPGVYELSGEVVRVKDAVDAAGGLLEDAVTDTVNLASPVVDGSKVHIPHADEATSPSTASGASSTSQDGVESSLVNINTADASALDTLPGVGASTANAIIEDRESNGAFTSIEDLMRVSGIGQKKFDKLKDRICV